MDDKAGIRQRQGMARGDGPMSDSTFGCSSIESMRGPSMGPATGDELSGSKRAVGEPVKHTRGKMPAQSQVDHGSHKYG